MAQSSELRGFLTSLNNKLGSRLTEYYTSRHPGQSAFKKYVKSPPMDDSQRSSVIRFAGPVDTQPLDLSVPKLPVTNQISSLASLSSLTSSISPSLSSELENPKPNKKGKRAGAEFEVEKEDGKVECGLCGKVYATKKCLKIHMRLHYGIKPYQCSFCPKTFAQSNVLKAHIAYHTGRRDWVCDICSKAFTQSAHLRTHRKTHSAQKDYQCPYCQRCFSSKQRCNTHVRHHTGEPNYRYVCLLCDKCFTRSESLRYHENSVHRGFRPYVCSEMGCGKTFSRQSSLKRHVRSVHSGPETEPVEMAVPAGSGYAAPSSPPVLRYELTATGVNYL